MKVAILAGGAGTRLAEETTQADFSDAVGFPVVRSWLDGSLREEKAHGAFLSGGVTVCAMLPMRSIPFRVICMVGMSDGAYPRRDIEAGFNLMKKAYRPGDRSRRNDDRYIFLEALVSARDVFYISYVGRSLQDNTDLPPSVLVSELSDYIREGCGIDAAVAEVDVAPCRTEVHRGAEKDTLDLGRGQARVGRHHQRSDRRSDPKAHEDEMPAHSLRVTDYYIMHNPVTNAQYQQFIQATGHRAPLFWTNGYPADKADHPVVGVSYYDAIAFWDATTGLAMGDPVDGRFTLVRTVDGGRTWTPVPPANIPAALPGDGAFAASGTCLVVQGSRHAWFGSGGAARARVYRSADQGLTWAVSDTPIMAGNASSGVFSLAFNDANYGIAVGGDYRLERESGDNLAITNDGGRTWAFAGATRLRAPVELCMARVYTRGLQIRLAHLSKSEVLKFITNAERVCQIAAEEIKNAGRAVVEVENIEGVEACAVKLYQAVMDHYKDQRHRLSF